MDAMGLFSTRDWNVIAIIFESKAMYRVNGNRSKGGAAIKTRDGAKTHARTIFWAVFDQKRAFLEGDAGPGANIVSPEIVQRLKRELPTNQTVVNILKLLETGQTAMAAKPLGWTGYPKVEAAPEE